MSKYQDLIVWQKAMTFVEKVYKVVDTLPPKEKFALADQLRRSAISIPSNIAEGQKRSGTKEVIQFSSIALGSLAEAETQLILAQRLYKVDIASQLELASEIGKMLSALIKSLR